VSDPLEDKWEDGKQIALAVPCPDAVDFSGVRSVTHCFADELFSSFPTMPKIVNASPFVTRILRAVTRGCGWGVNHACPESGRAGRTLARSARRQFAGKPATMYVQNWTRAVVRSYLLQPYDWASHAYAGNCGWVVQLHVNENRLLEGG
jgi:hypothetical protein